MMLIKSLKVQKIIAVFLLSILVSASFPKTVKADVYVPQPCKSNEVYIQESKLGNINEYQTLHRPIKLDPWYNPLWDTMYGNDSDHYCIDRVEYCIKFGCHFLEKFLLGTLGGAPTLVSTFRSLVINYILNLSFIALIYKLAKKPINYISSGKSVIKIFLITILGYIADILALFVIPYTIVLNSLDIIRPPFNQLIEYPLYSQTLWFSILSIFLMVSLIFYKIYSTSLFSDRRSRIKYSLFFGVLSNPIWYFLLLNFLNLRA